MPWLLPTPVDHSVVANGGERSNFAVKLLGEAGMLAIENDVLMIETANDPGMLARIAERLSEAGVNIEYTCLAATYQFRQRPDDLAA